MAVVAGWPDYLIARARRAPPPGCGVVIGATPVVWFGDPVRPAVATLGINPSSGEFLGRDGHLLAGNQRRLATLASLGVADYGEVSASLGSVIVNECARYFERRPYRWFLPLDWILREGAGVSYFDGSACHLDLVQWATSPLWTALDDSMRVRLLGEDEPFLVHQMRQEHYKLVVVNGRTVMRWTERAGLAVWRKVGHVPGPPSADLYLSDGDGSTFVGWSCNLQSQAGATRHSAALAEFVGEHAGLAMRGAPTMGRDHLPKGTRLSSISDLVDALETWLERSDADRLGATGGYGGASWLTVETPLGRVRLNADTRREAIERFVSASRSGPGLRMIVSASKRGRVNKVSFDGCDHEGWYAYLQEPLTMPDSRIVYRQGRYAHASTRAPTSSPAPSPAPSPPATASRVDPEESDQHADESIEAAEEEPVRLLRRDPVADDACIVQFPHPGAEHVTRGDAMPWNTRPRHRRKFLRSHGSAVSPDGVVAFEGQLAFWGEWEPPSTIERRWVPQLGLPTVLHVPCWNAPGPVGRRQNTDPWVFGSTFLYSNCKQLNPSGTPSAMQRLPVGSLILFGSARRDSVSDDEFVLDTLFVVADSIARYRPVDGLASRSEAFNVCTVDSLAAEPARHSEATFTLLRGATRQEPVNGMFSFVPCRRWIGDGSRFARPAIRLPGIVNPHSRQSPSGAKDLRPQAQIAAAWLSIVEQVMAADLELGVELVEPPRCP